MPKLLAEGKAFKPFGQPTQLLPIQQEQDYSAESLLNRQYQEELNQIEQEVQMNQQAMTSKAKYQMDTLRNKYWIERQHTESLRIPADKKREKLLALNAKYELAATTIRGKIRPDLDSLRSQREQAIQQTQMRLQDKLRELSYIERNGQEWGIDPKLIEARKYQAIGYSLPTAWFKQPDPMKRLQELIMGIASLEIQVEKTSGEERRNLLAQIEALHQERRNVMSQLVPGAVSPIRTASRLTETVAAAAAGKRPGTLNEGVLREKQKTLKANIKPFKGAPAGFTFGYIPKKKKEETKPTAEELRRRNTKEAYEEGKHLGYWD